MNCPFARLFVGALTIVFVATVHAQKTPPRPISTPAPEYPAELVDTGLSGKAIIEAVIKADGSVTDAVVKSADQPAFGAAAVAAIAHWRFAPGTNDGVATDRKVSLPFKFTAPQEQQMNAFFKRKVFLKLTEPVVSQKDFGRAPKVAKDARLVYPKALAGSKTEEKVQVQFVVAPDGTTVNPKIVGKPRMEFAFPALMAVAQTTYQPPKKDGNPVYVEMTRTLNFAEEPAERGRGELPGDFFGGGGGGRRRGGGGGGEGGGEGD
jgi:TonB family protein